MKENQVQLISNDGMQTFCDMFSCFSPAKWFVGRPDGPYNLMVNLCDKCRNELIKSIAVSYRDDFERIVGEIDAEETVRKAKEAYGGREFPCKICGEIFYSPVALASHVRIDHKEEKYTDE